MQEKFDTIVIGGGQAGLAAGYYLKQQGREFVILEANERPGETWRRRWDSLQLFTPAKYSSLPGLPLPAPPEQMLGKDDLADYLEQYANQFHLPLIPGTRADRLSRNQNQYVITAGARQFEARHVIVATGAFPIPRIPAFASELELSIRQIHSSQYRNPAQISLDDTLVVGVGNSGGELALELAESRRVFLAGTPTAILPKLPPKLMAPLMWWLLHRATAVDTWFGRFMRKRMGNKAAPLEGISEKDFQRAGITRLPAITGVHAGVPQCADGRVVEAANIVWATGFRHDFGWIKLPICDADGMPRHYRGVVQSEPGLYFVGLPFQYSISSVLIGGVGRDAQYVCAQIAARLPARQAKGALQEDRRVELASR